MTDSIERQHIAGFSYIVAVADYAPGDVIVPLGNIQTTQDDPRRLQLGPNHFILPPQIAHLCEPTAYIHWQDYTLRALKPIARAPSGTAGFDIGYHFATSEWSGYPSFACLCGSLACIGVFSGYADMNPEDGRRLDAYFEQHAELLPNPPQDFFSPYVRLMRQA